MSKQPTYTDEQKTDAVDLYIEHGAAEASRRTGINKRSISRWANAADVSADRDKNLIDAAERLTKQSTAQRAAIRVDLLDRVADVLKRMDEPHIDFRGKDATQVEWPTATSSDVKNYAVSFGILLDKYRLEMGEATEVIITGDMMDKALLEWETELGQNHTT